MAAAVVARFGVTDERPLAKAALVAIGGPVAEAVVLPVLASDRQLVVLDAIDVLVVVGGPAALAALEALTETGPDLFIRDAAAAAAEDLAGRLPSARP